MNVFFHENRKDKEEASTKSTLAGFESRVRFIDNIQPTLPLDDFAVRMTVL